MSIESFLREGNKITEIGGVLTLTDCEGQRVATRSDKESIRTAIISNRVARREYGGVAWYVVLEKHANTSSNGGARVKRERPADYVETRGRPRKGD